MRLHPLSTVSVGALALCACGHVPISTIWTLRNLDATTLDPALLRAAVRVPETLEPQVAGVKLEIGWWRDGEEHGKHNAKFALQETTSADETAPLASERKAGMRVYVYRVAPADILGIRALQAEAQKEKAKNPGKTHGTFGVGADACRKVELAAGPVLMTTFLRVDSERGYLPMVKDFDLRTAVTKDKSFDELVPPCEKFANRVKPKIDL